VLCGVLWGHHCADLKRHSKAADYWSVLAIWWEVLTDRPLFSIVELDGMARRAADNATKALGAPGQAGGDNRTWAAFSSLSLTTMVVKEARQRVETMYGHSESPMRALMRMAAHESERKLPVC
jgi:hypothetical protein